MTYVYSGEHVRALASSLVAGLGALGATVATPVADGGYGPLVCVASTDPEALVAELQSEGIVTSSRDANLRISLHLYNVTDDVERVLGAIGRRRHLLA